MEVARCKVDVDHQRIAYYHKHAIIIGHFLEKISVHLFYHVYIIMQLLAMAYIWVPTQKNVT